MPRFARGDILHLSSGKKAIEQAEKRRPLRTVTQQRFDARQRIVKPRSLQIAAVIEEANGLAEVQQFAREIVPLIMQRLSLRP